MEIFKAHWESDGDHLKLSMPIAKIDVERRIVSGFATLDNIDLQGDIVPSDASIKAFERFRGNIREMHDDKKAVGKLVSFKEDSFYDQETGKLYKGVFVSAYVSKGAQDTWEKVLDKTLTGFSIGGNIKDSEDAYNEDLDKSVRTIKEYDLYELSLVDNPANQYANVISIEKGHTGGYLSKALIENVFWCSEDDIVQLSAGSTSDCPRCDKGMNNIGFVETNDAQKADVVKYILSTIKNDVREVMKMENKTTEDKSMDEEKEKSMHEDEEMKDKSMHEDEEKEKSMHEDEEKEKSMHEDEEKEKSMDEDEEKMNPMDEDKMNPMDEEKMKLKEEMKSMEEDEMKDKGYHEDKEEMKNESGASMQQVKDLVNEFQSNFTMLFDTMKALNEKIEELNKTVTGVRQDVDIVKNEFGKRVDAVEKDTAFRKSGDLGEIVQEPIFIEKAQKSLWGGRFLTKSDLFA